MYVPAFVIGTDGKVREGGINADFLRALVNRQVEWDEEEAQESGIDDVLVDYRHFTNPFILPRCYREEVN